MDEFKRIVLYMAPRILGLMDRIPGHRLLGVVTGIIGSISFMMSATPGSRKPACFWRFFTNMILKGICITAIPL